MIRIPLLHIQFIIYYKKQFDSNRRNDLESKITNLFKVIGQEELAEVQRL